ncbi:beta strand repeat-containing protein [Granulicella rosea]|nr:choice-of-anchor D domain-containing protein [Granulicella rosea]
MTAQATVSVNLSNVVNASVSPMLFGGSNSPNPADQPVVLPMMANSGLTLIRGTAHVDQIVPANTTEAAYAASMPNGVGSYVPGSVADPSTWQWGPVSWAPIAKANGITTLMNIAEVPLWLSYNSTSIDDAPPNNVGYLTVYEDMVYKIIQHENTACNGGQCLTYLEILNEPDCNNLLLAAGDSSWSSEAAAADSVYTYAATGARAANPALIIGGDAECRDSGTFGTLSTLLADANLKAKGLLQFVSYHDYNPSEANDNITTLQAIITADGYPATMPIFLDEYNYTFTNPNSDPHVVGKEAATYIGDQLIFFSQQVGLQEAGIFTLLPNNALTTPYEDCNNCIFSNGLYSVNGDGTYTLAPQMRAYRVASVDLGLGSGTSKAYATTFSGLSEAQGFTTPGGNITALMVNDSATSTTTTVTFSSSSAATGCGYNVYVYVADTGTNNGSSPSQVLTNQCFSAGTMAVAGVAAPAYSVVGAIAFLSSPQGITNLAVTPASPGALMLTWQGASGAASYNINRSIDGGSTYSPLTNTTSLSFTDGGLSNSGNYCYTIQPINGAGNGPTSAAVCATVTSSFPVTGVTLTPAGPGAFTITYNALPNVTGYLIQQSVNGSAYTTLTTVTNTTYTEEGLTVGASYCVTVSGVFGGATAAPGPPVCGTSTSGSGPSGVTVTRTGDGQLTVTWSSGINYAGTTYTLNRSTNGQAYTAVSTGLTTTTYVDTGLTDYSSVYCYEITAVLDGVSSASSTAVCNSPASYIAVPNYSFETPVTTTYIYAPTGASWTFVPSVSHVGSGITANASAFSSGNSNAPDGVQNALIQETGTITQAIPGFTAGQQYKITVAASQRQNLKTQVGNPFKINVNGTTIASLNPPQSAATYSDYSGTFTAASASETIQFAGTATTDNTVFLDNVRIAPNPTATLSIKVQAVNIAQGAMLAVLSATGSFSGTAPAAPLVFSVDGGNQVAGSCSITSTTLVCNAAYAPTSALAEGTHTITAQYVGDGTYTAASATGTLNVGDTTEVQAQYGATSIVSPGSTNATVCVATANGAPTGNVQIYDGTALLTTQALQGGVCASWYISPSLSVGTHSLTAVYSGDANNPGGSSAPTTITVAAAPAGMYLTPTNYSFGNVRQGSSATEIFTLANGDGAAHAITSIQLTGEATNSYSSTNTCGASLNASSTCTITVTLKPTATGAISTTLQVVDASGTQTAALTGTGTQKANVFVTFTNQTLSVFPTDLSSQAITSSGGGTGAAVDASGSVLSINAGGGSLTKFSDLGSVLGTLSGGGLSGATALAIDGLSNVWVANGNGSVSEFNSGGTAVSSIPIGAAANLSQPASVSVDASGSLWIANAGNNTVTEIIGVAAPAAPIIQQVVNASPGVRP